MKRTNHAYGALYFTRVYFDTYDRQFNTCKHMWGATAIPKK
jgi:hypothetical protein